MNNNSDKNTCNCSENGSSNDICCTTKKSCIVGKIVFYVIIGLALLLISYKVFIVNPETENSQAKDSTSCCPKSEIQHCAKDTVSCCPKKH